MFAYVLLNLKQFAHTGADQTEHILQTPAEEIGLCTILETTETSENSYNLHAYSSSSSSNPNSANNTDTTNLNVTYTASNNNSSNMTNQETTTTITEINNSIITGDETFVNNNSMTTTELDTSSFIKLTRGSLAIQDNTNKRKSVTFSEKLTREKSFQDSEGTELAPPTTTKKNLSSIRITSITPGASLASNNTIDHTLKLHDHQQSLLMTTSRHTAKPILKV